jgi:glycosyltransferase involved in cell wall biosynthesis
LGGFSVRILIVTELWPPASGSFVFEQVESIAKFVSTTVAVLVPLVPNLSRYRSQRSPHTNKPFGPCQIPELGQGVTVYYLRYKTIPELSRYLDSWQAWRALQHFLDHQRERFDLIQAHFAYTAGFAAASAGQRFHIPVIVTVHGSDINYYTRRNPRNWVAAIFTICGLRHATAIIAVSEDLKQKVAALGVPEHRITVLPAGIPESLFFPRGEKRALRRQLQLPENDILFLYVGNFVRVKGLEFLLKAFARVHTRLPQATLLMVGDGEAEAALKQLANTIGIDQHIIWAGRKLHAEIPFWMSAADLLVLPSLSEGYGLVLVEALACGTPVIASRVGGIPEILISPDFGEMAPPGDSEALAQAMLAATEKTWDRKKIVAYAQAHTWAQRTQSLLQVYQSVLAHGAKNN